MYCSKSKGNSRFYTKFGECNFQGDYISFTSLPLEFPISPLTLWGDNGVVSGVTLMVRR